mgnify:CR=1 FL=1
MDIETSTLSAMLVPKSFLDDLRSRIRLSDVVGKRVKLSRAGREFKACCPFHSEKSASFYINDEKAFFHCFGCGAHGDHLGFLMRHENRSFMDAVEELAGLAGMQVPKPSVHEMERARGRERLVKLMDSVTQYYQARLFEQKDVLTYLTNRGLTLETIQAFRLGYSPANGKELIAELKKLGYSDAEMIEAGVTKKSDRDGSYFAFFRDRVMFPVTDRRGQTIAFGARVLPEHLRPIDPAQGKPPKYINSGETALFQKGHILYNESHARTAAARDMPVIVCEGYADVIALWQAGFMGAVAPLGTALTEAQIGSLWSMIPAKDAQTTREPVLCFDGDAAGQRAATRAMERILPLLQGGVSARFAFLTDGMDPDDLIRAKGKEAFEAVIARAVPLVDMIWRTMTDGRRFDTPESRAGLQKAIDGVVATIADRSVQKQYASELKDRFYKAFVKRGQGGKPAKQSNMVRLPDPKARGMNERARVALSAVISFPEIFHDAEDLLGRLHIDDPRLDSMRQSVMEILSDNPDMDHLQLAQALESQGFNDDLKAIMAVARLHGTSAREGSSPVQALEGLKEAAGSNR